MAQRKYDLTAGMNRTRRSKRGFRWLDYDRRKQLMLLESESSLRERELLAGPATSHTQFPRTCRTLVDRPTRRGSLFLVSWSSNPSSVLIFLLIIPPCKTTQIILTPQFPSRHWNQVNFDPPRKKQANFDPNTKTKSHSIPHTKIKVISTPPLKPSQFDPHSKVKSIFPAYKNQVNFDHPRKNQVNLSPKKHKSFLARTHNPSQYRSIHSNQIIFGSHTKPKSMLTPAQKTSNLFDQQT